MSELQLPPIESATSLMLNDAAKAPRELVKGLLHQGSKMIISGGSKTFKSWCMIDLAICMAMEDKLLKWLGQFECQGGRVLYVNFEIQSYFFTQRLKQVCERRGVNPQSLLNKLDVWNLRGHAQDWRTLLAAVTSRIHNQHYVATLLDPAYKLLGTTNENDNTEVAQMLNGFEDLAQNAKCAIIFSGHFAKGDPNSKQSIDRTSGAGVFARDPDTILTITGQKSDTGIPFFTVESTLRNHPSIDPFNIMWDYPLMVKQDGLKAVHKGGRPPKADDSGMLSILVKDGTKLALPIKEWKRQAATIFDISDKTFQRRHKVLREAGKVHEVNGLWSLNGDGHNHSQNGGFDLSGL